MISYHSLMKMTAKRTMKAQKYQVMPNKRSAAAYSLWKLYVKGNLKVMLYSSLITVKVEVLN